MMRAADVAPVRISRGAMGWAFPVSAIVARLRRVTVCLVLLPLFVAALYGCRPPAEEDVCVHMLDVLGTADVASCTQTMRTVRERVGTLRYRAYSTCILRAATAREIVVCRSNLE